MLGVALFEGSFRYSDVVLSYGIFGCCNFSVVHDAGSDTVVFQGAGSFFAAVASVCWGGLISRRSDASSARQTDLYSIKTHLLIYKLGEC